MNYITLINAFWAKDLEHSFTPNDIAVYFRLLERCNALGWKNPFNFSVDELLVKLRLRTKDPLDTARNRLKQAGLLDFRNGQGRGHTTTYWLATPLQEPEENPERGQKNTPFISPYSPPFSPTFSPPTTPLVHKTKLNKTKEETANAVTGCAGAQASDSMVDSKLPTKSAAEPPKGAPSPGKKKSKPRAARPAPAAPPPLETRWPELVAELDAEGQSTWARFVAWEKENPLPKVFSMVEPLLPKQLVELTHKHGSGEVTSILLDMQNRRTLHADYDSANLTVQAWLRLRKKREAALSS
ncbi:hypothetical protein [Hymenobacter sp. YC55]|uniref:hypothetical protein n=1 Tax=Hymenobacter sp. YC55 TaxID=3034019 RepID=UPI0023F80949|nr:hypothetical protein [Hymenobacter sp. YC55]MDF7810927.1 hypothetical protein [Hymenobacter sp. YC55]